MPLPSTSAAPVDAEVVVVRLRRHGRRLLLPVLVLIATAGAAGYWVGSLPDAWMNITAAAAAALVAFVLGIGPILGWLATRTTITTRRVIMRRGFFVHHRNEVPLARVREVRSRRGPVQRVFGSGNVVLVVGAEVPVVLRDVPGPVAVADALQELVGREYARDSTAAVQFRPVPGAAAGAAPPGFSPHGGADVTTAFPR